MDKPKRCLLVMEGMVVIGYVRSVAHGPASFSFSVGETPGDIEIGIFPIVKVDIPAEVVEEFWAQEPWRMAE